MVQKFSSKKNTFWVQIDSCFFLYSVSDAFIIKDAKNAGSYLGVGSSRKCHFWIDLKKEGKDHAISFKLPFVLVKLYYTLCQRLYSRFIVSIITHLAIQSVAKIDILVHK